MVLEGGEWDVEVHGPGAMDDVGQSSVIGFLFGKRWRDIKDRVNMKGMDSIEIVSIVIREATAGEEREKTAAGFFGRGGTDWAVNTYDGLGPE